MSGLKELGDKISAKGKELLGNAKAASETSSLNNVIRTEQNKIDTNYKLMGKLYFEKYGDSPESEFAEAIAAIRASMKKIEETKGQIEKIKKRNCCPNCGTRFKSGAMFCSKCGNRVDNAAETRESAPKQLKCAGCGNIIEDGALFCDSCGLKVGSEPEEQPAQETAALPESTDSAKAEEDVPKEPDNTPSEPDDTPSEPEAEKPQEEADSSAVSEEASSPKPYISAPRICNSCGAAVNEPDALFCDVCGAKL